MGAGVLTAQAQQSAQASMQVTVTVVEGSKMQLSLPAQVLVKQDEKTSLGQITLDKKEKANTRVHTNPKISLLAANGSRMDMDVETKWKESGSERHLMFTGSAKSLGHSKGDYKGELKTTVEYN